MTEPRTLSQLVGWFLAAWQAEMPVRLHDRATIEPDGAPHWHAAFRSYLLGNEWAVDQDGTIRRPLRAHWSIWARASGRNSMRARWLFVLACKGGDVHAAWQALRGPAPSAWERMHREDSAGYTLRRFLEVCQATLVRELPPRERGVLRRVGKSESQHRAEEAV